MYQGILKYTDNSFYNFSTESKAAEYLGVASYNCDSLKKYFSDKGATNECYRILESIENLMKVQIHIYKLPLIYLCAN